MIILYIIGAIILFLVLVLLLPLKVELGLLEDFWVKVKFFGFTVYPQKEKPKKKKVKTKSNDSESEPKENNLFQKLIKKHGFKGAINELFILFKAVIIPFKKFLKALKFRKIKVDLAVSGSDACETAVNYGMVCSIVYPVLSLFDTLGNVKYKKIDVRSNFQSGNSNFEFSLDIKTPLLVLLIFGFKIFKEYKNFCVRNDL